MKLGFIGCGNMAKAMIGGILKNKIAKADEIVCSTSRKETADQVKAQLGIKTAESNIQVAKESDILILAVKPQFYPQVIREIKDTVTKDQRIITLAPGKTIQWITDLFERTDLKLTRTMPNTPALVTEGITGMCFNENVTDSDKKEVIRIFEGFGKAEIVPEHLMDVVVSVSGSSPAYVFLIIEAMADAAVADGMPRPQAYRFASQAVLGSAKMVLETGKHPGELKDMVCSPGGTTIEAVRVLEQKGLRSAIIESMKACTQKSREM